LASGEILDESISPSWRCGILLCHHVHYFMTCILSLSMCVCTFVLICLRMWANVVYVVS